MDIEGGEVLALPGMQRILAEARPVIVDGTARARIQPGALGDPDRRPLRDLLDAAWLSAVPTLEAMGWKAYILARPR